MQKRECENMAISTLFRAKNAEIGNEHNLNISFDLILSQNSMWVVRIFFEGIALFVGKLSMKFIKLI